MTSKLFTISLDSVCTHFQISQLSSHFLIHFQTAPASWWAAEELVVWSECSWGLAPNMLLHMLIFLSPLCAPTRRTHRLPSLVLPSKTRSLQTRKKISRIGSNWLLFVYTFDVHSLNWSSTIPINRNFYTSKSKCFTTIYEISNREAASETNITSSPHLRRSLTIVTSFFFPKKLYNHLSSLPFVEYFF